MPHHNEPPEPIYNTFNSAEKPKNFSNWTHDKYFEETKRALIRELNSKYVDQAENARQVKNALEMFQMRNGRWFFTYCCEDGSYGFEYSDEALGVPEWIGWAPESVSFNKELDKDVFVTIDGDKTRLYPLPAKAVPQNRRAQSN